MVDNEGDDVYDGHCADCAGWGDRFALGAAHLLDAITVDRAQPEKIVALDIRGCRITDSEMWKVAEVVEALPACTRVDVRENPLGALCTIDTTLQVVTSLLHKRDKLLIIMTGCPLATADFRATFWVKIPVKIIARIIWIAAPMLQGAGWRALVAPGLQKAVLHAHCVHYGMADD